MDLGLIFSITSLSASDFSKSKNFTGKDIIKINKYKTGLKIFETLVKLLA